MRKNVNKNKNTQENFLADLAYKMAKAIDKKDHSAFLNLKSTFASLVSKINTDKASESLSIQITRNNNNKRNVEDHLRKALKVDKWARAIEARWDKLSKTEKAKFAIIKSKNIEFGYKYSGQKFADTLETKRLDLEKNGIFVSREAYYELISLGYKAESISKKDQSYSLPVLGKRTKLVFNSENEFYEYLKKHEDNFNSDINRVMEC